MIIMLNLNCMNNDQYPAKVRRTNTNNLIQQEVKQLWKGKANAGLL